MSLEPPPFCMYGLPLNEEQYHPAADNITLLLLQTIALTHNLLPNPLGLIWHTAHTVPFLSRRWLKLLIFAIARKQFTLDSAVIDSSIPMKRARLV